MSSEHLKMVGETYTYIARVCTDDDCDMLHFEAGFQVTWFRQLVTLFERGLDFQLVFRRRYKTAITENRQPSISQSN